MPIFQKISYRIVLLPNLQTILGEGLSPFSATLRVEPSLMHGIANHLRSETLFERTATQATTYNSMHTCTLTLPIFFRIIVGDVLMKEICLIIAIAVAIISTIVTIALLASGRRELRDL